MRSYWYERHGRTERLVLGTLLGEGAAGQVFAVPGLRGLAAKIYKSAADAAEYEEKIGVMISSRPNLPDIKPKHRTYRQIAWPHARVLDAQGRFAGFLMPEIDFAHSCPLESILQKSSRRVDKIAERYHLRVAVAANMASVFTELHRLKHYMIDMKPDNLRLYPDAGYLAVVDTDGFSVRGPKRFPAQQVTDNYIAPEGRGRRPEHMGEGQDRFALAVILFQLLNNGLHPYSGVVPPGNTMPSDLQSRIYANLYGYGLRPHPEIRPALASIHTSFDGATRQLFDRSFLGGGGRPTAKEWRDHLRKLMGEGLVACTVNPREHAHFGSGCGLCEWDKRVAASRRNAPATRRRPSTPTGFSASQPLQVPVPRPASPMPPRTNAPPFQPPKISQGAAVAVARRSHQNVASGVIGVILLLLAVRACDTGNGPQSTPTSAGTGASTFSVAWFADAQPYVVTPKQGIDTINLRSGPGGQYSVVSQLSRGAAVTARGRSYDSSGVPWLSVAASGGLNGFIAERLLRLDAQSGDATGAANSNPSFSCAAQLSFVEERICSDATLGAKDRGIAASYRQLLGALAASARTDAITMQRSWIEERDRCGGSGDITACLHDTYDRRARGLSEALAAAREALAEAQLNAPNSGWTDRGDDRARSPSPATISPQRRSTNQPRPRPQDESNGLETSPAVTCVLPSGAEVRLTQSACRSRSGVIY